MNAWDIYWVTRCDAIQTFFLIVTVMSVAASVTCLISWCVARVDGGHYKTQKVICLIALPVCLIASLTAVFVPTTNHAAAMYVLPAIVNNEKVQELPDKFLNLAGEWIEELRPEQKETEND